MARHCALAFGDVIEVVAADAEHVLVRTWNGREQPHGAKRLDEGRALAGECLAHLALQQRIERLEAKLAATA